MRFQQYFSSFFFFLFVYLLIVSLWKFIWERTHRDLQFCCQDIIIGLTVHASVCSRDSRDSCTYVNDKQRHVNRNAFIFLGMCIVFISQEKKSLKLHLMWKMNPVCQRLWSLSICSTFTSVIYSDPLFCFVLSTCNIQLTCTSLSPVYFQGATEIMKKNTGIKNKKKNCNQIHTLYNF